MQCRIVDRDGKLVRTIDAQPVCGKDFCDGCGDCLYCFVSDDCYRTGEPQLGHRWVLYTDMDAERIAELTV
jgi:hypothetical protein